MTREELLERQSWSLEKKIDHSLGVIEDFYAQLNGKVAVSFSGGKDSTVLYWLARKLFPDIKAVFCNTGNEYPDIVKFVRGMKNDGYNIDIIYPEMKPCEVIAEHGFPLISKETAQRIWYTKHKPDSQVAKIGRGEIGNGKFRIPKKYLYLVDAEYDVTPKCCDILKKHPFDKYRKEHGVNFFIGTMASESMNRTTSYLRQGSCNHYDWKDMRRTKSLPLSIWTEEDILECIKRYNIPIAEIYNKGAQRTGCMFCSFGAQFAHDTRMQMVYDMYPKYYEKCMNYENNGTTYREAMREFLGVNGLYLPDERPEEKEIPLTLF